MKRLFTFIAVVFVILSCQDEKPTELSVEDTSIEFSKGKDSKYLSFTTNKDWQITLSEKWCTLSESSGTAGKFSLLLQVEENTSFDDRTCTLTIRAAELTKSITITQDQNTTLYIPVDSFSLDNSEQEIEVQIQTNLAYSVAISEDCKDWISDITTKAIGEDKKRFAIAANDSYDNRVGTIVVTTDNGEITKTIQIKQGQTNGLFVEQKEYFISQSSQTLSINIQSNIDYKIICNEDWIKRINTKALSGSTLSLFIEENNTYQERIGAITIESEDGTLSENISINQAKSYYLYSEPSTLNLNSKSQHYAITIKANSDWAICIPDDAKSWITVTPDNGENESTVTFSFLENNSSKERSAEINILSSESELTSCINITQAAPKMQLNLSITAGTLKDTIESMGVDYLNVDELTLSGDINGNDLAVLRTMLGNDKYFIQEGDEPSKGSLEYLNIQNCNLIPGSEIYMYQYGSNYNIKEYNVIPHDCFRACSKLRKIILPENTSFSQGATLFSCYNLEEVVLPKRASTIPSNCFAGCRNLKEINMQNIKTIENYAFNGCFSLERVTLEKIETIRPSAFERCKSLKEFIVSTDNIYYSTIDGALYSKDKTILYCYPGGLTGEFSTPQSVEQVGAYAFSETHLDKVVLSEGLRVLGERAFESSNMETLIIPDSVTEIGCLLLTDNANLKHIRLSSNVSYVPTIENCTALEEIDIPEGVKTITGYGNSSYCFNGCTSLRKITIPSSMTDISGGFVNTVITEVHCKAVKPQTFKKYPFKSNAIVYVPKGSKSEYQSHPEWSKFTIKEE